MPDDLLRIPPEIARWRDESVVRHHPVLDALAEKTSAMRERSMQTAPEQAELLAFLVELTRAHLVVEVGTFTGYGALAMALALPEDGRLVTIDLEDWNGVAERHWEEAGVSARIERRLGPAEEVLGELLRGPERGEVDLAYIDADKERYPRYLEQSLELVRPGGVVALDNLFWGGTLADPEDHSPEVTALREVLNRCREDRSLGMTLVPIADGLLLVRRR